MGHAITLFITRHFARSMTIIYFYLLPPIALLNSVLSAISLMSGTTFLRKNVEFGPCVKSKIDFAAAIKVLASASFSRNHDNFAILKYDKPRVGFFS